MIALDRDAKRVLSVAAALLALIVVDFAFRVGVVQTEAWAWMERTGTVDASTRLAFLAPVLATSVCTAMVVFEATVRGGRPSLRRWAAVAAVTSLLLLVPFHASLLASSGVVVGDRLSWPLLARLSALVELAVSIGAATSLAVETIVAAVGGDRTRRSGRPLHRMSRTGANHLSSGGKPPMAGDTEIGR